MTDNSPDSVWLIALNWNGKKFLEPFLESAQKINYKNLSILVIDNGSKDSSVNFIKSNYPNIHILENKKNLGYSCGLNKGIDYAIRKGARYLLISNNDLIFDKEIVNAGFETMNLDSRIGYVGGKVFDIVNTNRLQYAGGRLGNRFDGPSRGYGEIDVGKYEEIEDFAYMDDVTAFVRVKMINEIGSYDNDFFYDFEETEWNYRIIKSGWRIVYCPKMKVWHRLHGSTGGTKFTPIPEFHHTRGHFLFYYKTQSQISFLLFILKYLFIGIIVRFIVLSKNNSTRLIYYNIRGMLSALKRVINQ